MKKYFNLTGFYPFERKQFEDFLNDMAKKGYHLKSFNSFFSEYEENNDEIYYHVAIKEKKNVIFTEPCDESYMTFLKIMVITLLINKESFMFLLRINLVKYILMNKLMKKLSKNNASIVLRIIS